MNVPKTADEKSDIIAKALEKMDEGWTLNQCAEDAGILHGTLRRWMMSEAPDRYKVAQTNGLMQRIIEADDRLDNAGSYLEITRADKQAKYARWDAERRAPRLFAPRQELTGAGGEALIPVDLSEAARKLAFVMAMGGVKIIDVTPETPLLQTPVDK